MEFCRPLERPLVMIVGPPLRVGPTIMTAGRSAGRQNSITPSQIMLLLYRCKQGGRMLMADRKDTLLNDYFLKFEKRFTPQFS